MTDAAAAGRSLSPFYDLLEEAQEFTLVFQGRPDSGGPVFADDGSQLPILHGRSCAVDVRARPLGGNRYRLCETAYFSDLTGLLWGDEFFAEPGDGRRLRLAGVAMPRRYRHCTLVGRFDPYEPVADIIHRLGGGWELVCGGILTISIPAEQWDGFVQLARSALPDGVQFDP